MVQVWCLTEPKFSANGLPLTRIAATDIKYDGIGSNTTQAKDDLLLLVKRSVCTCNRIMIPYIVL